MTRKNSAKPGKATPATPAKAPKPPKGSAPPLDPPSNTPESGQKPPEATSEAPPTTSSASDAPLAPPAAAEPVQGSDAPRGSEFGVRDSAGDARTGEGQAPRSTPHPLSDNRREPPIDYLSLIARAERASKSGHGQSSDRELLMEVAEALKDLLGVERA